MELIHYNIFLRSKGLHAISVGKITHELKNIVYARKHFKGGNYYYFVVNFNLMNIFSLVCHPVCYHNYIFHCGTESFENKAFLVYYSRDGYHSHGGSMIGNHCSFAILDWGYESLTRKKWLRANFPRYGHNQNSRATDTFLDDLPIKALSEIRDHSCASRRDWCILYLFKL